MRRWHDKKENGMRIPNVKAQEVFIEITKRGPGDYVVRCESCGFREEIPGSLAHTKIIAKAHRVVHEVFENMEADEAGGR